MGCNAVFILARLHSSRLPRKMILDLCGRRIIEYQFINAKKVQSADRVILCTTDYGEDSILCQIAESHGIDCFRGSSEDKMIRMLYAAEKFNVDSFVTMDGDDLFCDPYLQDLAFKQAKETGADFIEQDGNLPIGSFTYWLSRNALKKMCTIKDTDNTEMMFEFFKDRTDLFKVESLKGYPENYNRPDLRCTLDYYADYKFFEAIISNMKDDYTLSDVIEYTDQNPSIVDINSHLNEIWRANQLSKTHLAFKDTDSGQCN